MKSPSAKFGQEHDLARYVEQKWAEAFIVELRLQGVSGQTLGSSLAEVDSHCAESGDTASEAFGDPEQYARSLELPSEDDHQSARSMIRALVPTLVQVIGLLALMRAAPSYTSGPVELTAGDFALWGMVAAAIAALGWKTGALMRFVMAHPVAAVGLNVLFFALMVVPLFMWQQPAAEVPVLGMVLAGAVCLVAGTVWEIRRVRAGADDDEISRPLEDPAVWQRRRRFTRWMNYFRIFIFPVMGGVLTAVVLILS